MHVLFVIDTWGLIGGTERHAADVVPALEDRGLRVTILCRTDQRPGFSHAETLVVPAFASAALARAERSELASRLRELRPDVILHSACRNVDAAELFVESAPVVRFVHDHTLFCPGLNKYREDGETCHEAFGAVCLRRYFLTEGCVCFKRTGRAHPIRDAWEALRGKWREIDIARRATLVLTNSNYMRNELLQAGLDPESTRVLYLFTRSNTSDQPAKPLPPATQSFLESSNAPLVFTPTRLTLPDKGLDHLITALGEIRTPFRAVIAGQGPAETWLRAKTRAEGLGDRVHFTGWLDSGGVETLYARADLVVCPSVWDEPFGLVGIEAMAHAKPVVAFRVGGIPEWLEDGVTGFLVPRKDTSAMAAAIERLLQDPPLRERLGQAGRVTVRERFNRERHVGELERALALAAGA